MYCVESRFLLTLANVVLNKCRSEDQFTNIDNTTWKASVTTFKKAYLKNMLPSSKRTYQTLVWSNLECSSSIWTPPPPSQPFYSYLWSTVASHGNLYNNEGNILSLFVHERPGLFLFVNVHTAVSVLLTKNSIPVKLYNLIAELMATFIFFFEKQNWMEYSAYFFCNFQ